MATLDELKQIKVARVEVDTPGRTPALKFQDPDFGLQLIPKERYISPEFMKLEWERMWTKVWLMGGRLEFIPEPGDWISNSIGRESLLFVRQDDGSVRGFYNVCPHRGNRLVGEQASGSAATFKCSYHHWEWTTDGDLHKITDRETFHNLPPCSTLALKQVKVELWGGFFWYNLNPDAEPLAEFLGDIPAHLDPYEFERMKIIDWKTLEWDTNWKTSMDAFNEVYHVQAIHSQLLPLIDAWNTQIDCFGKHNRFLVPFSTPSPQHDRQDQIAPGLYFVAEEVGVNATDYEDDPRELRLAIQRAKRAMTDTIFPYDRMNDDQLSDDYHYSIFPNATMNVYAESMLLFVQRPHPTDPDKMLFDLMNFAHLPDDKPYQQPDHKTYKHGQIGLGEVLDQDSYALPIVQQGMHSAAYEGLILGDQEIRIRHFHKTLMDYIDPDGTSGL